MIGFWLLVVALTGLMIGTLFGRTDLVQGFALLFLIALLQFLGNLALMVRNARTRPVFSSQMDQRARRSLINLLSANIGTSR